MAELLPEGVYAALLTPLQESGQVDTASLSRLVGGLVDAGVDGLCPVGSAGEGPLLGPERRAQVVQTVCEHVDGRVPVVPTVCQNDLPSATADLERFANLGAAAALVTAPSFYAFAPAELTGYFRQLADTASIGLLLYDIPAFAGVQIGADVIAALAVHDNIIGLKDSTGDAANLRAVLDHAGVTDFHVYCGSEPLFATAAQLGAAGVIGASVNVVPTQVRDLWRSAQAGDRQSPAAHDKDAYDGYVEDQQARLTSLAHACRSLGRPFGWKAAAARLGLCELHYCQPVTPPQTDALYELDRTLASLALIERTPERRLL